MKTNSSIFPLKSSFVMVLCFLWNFNGNTQLNIDSLKIAFDYSEIASERVQTQILIAESYHKQREYEAALIEYRRAIDLIPNDNTFLKAETIYKYGNCLKSAEHIEEARKGFKTSIQLYTSISANPELIARNNALIGRCFYDEANYDSAMVYYLEAEKIYEINAIKNRDYGMLFHFIGSVFKRQGDFDKSCEYYQKEIKYGKEHGFKDIEAEGQYLIGVCIETDSARLANDILCLQLYSELGNERLVGLMYQLISNSYYSMNELDSALHYQQLSLEIRREQNEISHLAGILSDLAKTYIAMGKLSEAKSHLKEAEEIALQTGIKKYVRLQEIYGIYYDLEVKASNYKEANRYLNLVYAYKDSVMNTEHKQAIAELAIKYDSDKQEAQLAILEQEKLMAKKEKILADEAASNQSFYNKIILSTGIALLFAGIFIYLKYRESQKQKIVISAQKREMQFQKELVEEKNKDITDSMVYASSIQKAIITSEEYLSKMFKDFFVFYQPRDIVSGDFYWAFETTDGTRLVAVGDCTGHGVPGAMMSMLGNAFLNEIVIEGKNYEPNKILDKLRDQVKRALQNNAAKDGMDMSILKIKDKTITYAGANLPLYLLRSGELIEVKGDKQPIGSQPAGEKPFTQHTIDLIDGDSVYLFSDGYADQFGGVKGKKYKYKTFRDKLSLISSKPFKEQGQIISAEFEQWKGDLEQLDDVCVLGLKL